METRLVKAFLPKKCCIFFFVIKMATNMYMPLYWSDKNIDNHSFIGYLKVRNTGIPWQMQTNVGSAVMWKRKQR